jgi:hypothetical protein
MAKKLCAVLGTGLLTLGGGPRAALLAFSSSHSSLILLPAACMARRERRCRLLA